MIKEIIVVEGVNDTKRLRSFFDVETIETHGLGLNKDTIELIRKLNENRGVILLLDPDHPGEKIRNTLNEKIPGLKNAFVMKEDARTSKKVGVEHASKEILEEAYYELGLKGNKDSDKKRQIVSKYFHTGKANGKTLFKRLNMLGLTYDDIVKVINDI